MKDLLIVLYFIVSISYAQNDKLIFTHLTTDDGLSQSNVLSMIQDKYGFLWFGTFDGLNRYDGYKFTVYKPDQRDSTTVRSSSIQSLFEDKSGRIWIGTSQGLCYYNRDKDNFFQFRNTDFDNTLNSEVKTIFEDDNNNLWIGTITGLLCYDKISGKFYKIIDSLLIRNFFIDSRKNVWVGTGSAGLRRYNIENNSFISYSIRNGNNKEIKDYDVRGILEDKDGFLWVGTYGYGLIKIDLNDLDNKIIQTYHNIPGDNKSLSGNLILSIVSDGNGLWIGTENESLNYLKRGSSDFIKVPVNPDISNNLNDDSIYSMMMDKSGDMWFGTFFGGLNHLDQTNQAINSLKKIPGTNSLSSNVVRGFAEDKNGNIYIATDGGGLDYYNLKTRHFSNYNSSNSNILNNAVLTVFADSKGNIWLGYWNGGLSLFDKNKRNFKSYTTDNSQIGSKNIFDITEDKDGNLWISSTDGFIRFNPESESFKMFNTKNTDLPNNHIEVIRVDSQGNILVGTTQGLSIYNPVTGQTKNYFPNYDSNDRILSTGFVISLFEESPTVLWIGTINGLNRLDRITGKIEKWFTQEGLPNNSIRGIQIDKEGNVWLSTNKGISKYNPEKNTFKNFNMSYGLQGNEYVINSCYKTRDGHFLFGGINGFDYFLPEYLKDNPFIPPVWLTGFFIFNEQVKPGNEDLPLATNLLDAKEIKLSYKQSVFSFEFTALNYRVPNKNQYAYIMKGFENEWNYVGDKRTATYTNLDPGEYVFTVKASNNNSIWNDKGTSVKVIISPPFWLTIWFRGIIIVIVFAIIFIIFKIVIQRNKIKLLQKTDKLKSEFLAQMSHEIRTPINVIFSYLSIIEQEFNELTEEEVNSFFQSIHKSGNRIIRTIELLLNMSEIQANIYDYNPIVIDLEKDILFSIYDEYKIIAKERNLELKIVQTNKIPKLKIDEYTAKQIFSNLVDNALKYTEKGSIHIIFGFDSTVYVKIKDTGIGIKNEYLKDLFNPFTQEEQGYTRKFEGNGLGLALVKKYCEINNAEIAVESVKGKGSTFEIRFGKESISKE